MQGNEQVLVRKQKRAALKDSGAPIYPNDFSPTQTAAALLERFAEASGEGLENETETFALAGRIISLRKFGKAAFFHLQDRTGQIQVYIRKGESPQEAVSLLLDGGVPDSSISTVEP